MSSIYPTCNDAGLHVLFVNSNVRMEPFKRTKNYLVFSVGIIYYWSVISLLAAICIPYLASQESDVDADNSSSEAAEGSGHGNRMDILGYYDDNLVEDDSDKYIDDNSTWAESTENDSFSDLDRAKMAVTISEDISTPFYSVEARCFRCHGDGVNGCDVTTMMSDVYRYSTSCQGKCLNVSSGSTSAYDCAHDILAHLDTCLQNGDTQMCLCTGNFCNGPSNFYDFYTQFSPPNHLLPFDDPDYIYDTDDFNDSSSQMNNTTNSSTSETSKNNTFLNGSNIEYKKTDNVSNSYEYELFLENSTGEFPDEILPNFEHVHKHEIDFHIPENNMSISNDTTMRQEVSNAVDVNDIRVGNLKDRSIEVDCGDRALSGTALNTVIAVMSSVFILHSIL